MSLFTPPNVRATDANSNSLSGGLWYFYVTNTLTPATVYTTSARNVAHANPVVADAGGKFPNIYLDPAVIYRAIQKTAGGTTLYDFDPIAQTLASDITTDDGNLQDDIDNLRLQGAIGTLEEAQDGAPVAQNTQLVIVSGAEEAGDVGTGMPLIYDAAVDAAYVTANPNTSFLDETGRGYRFQPQPWTGTLSRDVPDSAFSVLPIKVTGVGPRGLTYSEDPISYAYRTEISDGRFSADSVFCAPYGDDTTGDGSPNLPWREVTKALSGSTTTNIHLLPAADGSVGYYDIFSLRYDINPTGCSQLRVLIAHGPVAFKRPSDDISIDAVASGTVSIDSGDTLVDGDTVTIDGNVITFKTTPTGPLDIPLVPGESRLHWGQRLTSCINANSVTLGTNATFLSLVGSLIVVLIHANEPGAGGNAITLAVSSTHSILTVSGATLAGGGDGWTDEGDGVWSYQTTSGYSLPRAVINHAVLEPETGQPTPLAYYGNARRITFSGQPSVGHYLEVTSGYAGATRRLSFVASGGGTYDEITKLGTVNIGATLAETLDNFVRLINGNSLYLGLIADSTGTVVRMSARLNSTPTISATISGGTMSLSSQTAGYDELATFALVATANIPFAAFSVGGWAFDEATRKLYVKLAAGLDVQTYKANLELLVGDSNARCFIWGGRIGFLGNIQWRGTFLFATPAPDPATYPTRLWGTFTNPKERPVGFVTPMDNGLFEMNGVQSVFQGAWGYCTTIDTYHLTSSGSVGATTQVIRGGSELAGDPLTFLINEFPNRNGISPHGNNSVTGIFESDFNRSVGPNIIGEGKIWLVDAHGNQSWGLGAAQFGLSGIAGGTYWADSSNFASNVDGDVSFAAGTINQFQLGARYKISAASGKDFIPPAISA